MTPANDNGSRLFVKSYFAASVQEAMESARVELGPDALLMNTRKSPAEAEHLGEMEVVFGVRPSAGPVPGESGPDPIADLRQRMEELRKMVTQMGAPVRPSGPATASIFIEEALVKAGLTRELAADIDAAVQKRITAQEGLNGRGVVEIGRYKAPGCSAELLILETIAEIESRFSVAPDTGRVIALVGPPGSGKTSALVKLAVLRGVGAGRPVRLISMDNYRIAAAEQLRTYASILGVPFITAETPQAAAQAIDSAPPETLLLIDTAGYTSTSLYESGQEVAAFFRRRQDLDTHLVLTASMRHADLQRTVDLFSAFQPSKLLFTRLDETDSTAAIFCEAARTGKPLSFFSTGQVIPEDLEAASKSRISAALAGELPLTRAAVA